MYSATKGRFEISNAWTCPSEALYIFTEESVKDLGLESWGVSVLKGAFRQIGMVKGGTQFVGTSFGTDPLVLNSVPILQNHMQLFIEGSLGIPGLVQGPMGRTGHYEALCHCSTDARAELRCGSHTLR